MDEAILNGDMISLFKSKGALAYKIPDPDKTHALTASKRPFDGFARFSEFDFWFESKLIKNSLQAFALDRVEDHQWENLLLAKKNNGVSAVTLGFWISRKEYKLFVFDPEFLLGVTKTQKSILKKQLEWYDSQGWTISLKSKEWESFTPSLLKTKMITSLPPVKGE